MSNKENLKKAIERDFDKDKIYNEIVKKMERGSNMNKVLKYSLVPACLIAVVCGIMVFNNNSNQLQGKPTIDKPTIKENENNNEIYVNNFDKVISGALRVDADVKPVSISELPSKFNYISSLDIPKDLKQTDIYALYFSDDGKEIEDKKYDILHDYVIRYESNDNKRNIRIAVSEISNPVRDYQLGEAEKMSKINNVDVEISKYKDLYLASFKYNDLFFDVETSGITIDELVDVLESIIK